MTTSILRGALAVLAHALALATLAAPAPAAAQRALTAEQWREDLRFLARELPARHRDPFTRVSRERFDSAVAELEGRIPALSDHEVVVGLARIVAMLRDGHTRLTLPQDPDVAFRREHTPTPLPKDSSLVFHHLPVRFDLFSDGLFVRAASERHRDLIGAKVLEIGRMPADSALEAVRSTVHYDNEYNFRFLAPVHLVVPEVLHATGVTATPDRTRLLVQDRSGRRREVVLAPLVLFSKPELIEARDVGRGPTVLSERRRDAKYWMEFIPRSRTLYVQVNEINHDSTEEVPVFARRIEQVLADSAVERVVLDLRYNSGGNWHLSRPLILALVRNGRTNRFGRWLTLTGRETFSAAQLMVNELEFLSNTLFMGEPTGSSPTAHGDSRKFELPNSGLTVRASSIYWRDWTGDEKRPWTAPDLPVAVSSADYFANRDPVLEAALAFDPASMTELLSSVARAGGMFPASRVVFRYSNDPTTAGEETEEMMSRAGLAILEAGRAGEAVAWFDYALRSHPGSAQAHLGRGRALLAAGEREKARDALRRAAELDPANARARELLAELARTR